MRRTERTSSRARGGLLLLPALLAACAGAPEGTGRADADPGAEISALLQAHADSWNAGDLDGFLELYMDSSETAFVGGSGVIRGLDAIRARYLQGNWRTGTPAYALRFEDLEISSLGADHALAVARWVLFDRTTDSTASSGYFSVIFRRTPEGWRIIHDHTSAAP